MAALSPRALVRVTVSLCLLATLLSLTLGRVGPAQAAGLVTTCTEQGLADAMNAGSGLITFDCGPSPVVITMTAQNGGLNVISGRADTIDGGDKVTLTGAGAQRLFDVRVGGALTLTHIILTDGYAATLGNLPDWGGAVLAEGNRLVLDHVTIRNSQSLHLGGAVRVVAGTVIIQDSLIENNQSADGGGIDSAGALTMINTIVRGNHAQNLHGGGLLLRGAADIRQSQIYSNTAVGINGGGGGLYLTASANATIAASQITSNTATADSALGGGIENLGTLSLTTTSLSGNQAFAGGGLANTSGGQAALDQMTVRGNYASSYSGGLNNDGVLTMTNSSLIGNRVPTTAEGGGLGAGGDASTTFANSLVGGNTAGSGAGLASAGGPLRLTNVTLSGNNATGSGGGLLASYGASTLINVTFSSNLAAHGGNIYFLAPGAGDTLTLKNTLLANGGAGGNCVVGDGSANDIASAGFNLSDDHSCETYFNQASDKNAQPAGLFPLANNGGLSLTHLPQRTSLVIDNGTGGGCPATDQRGQPRPAGGFCDIGAVEVQPTDLAWALFLPAARR